MITIIFAVANNEVIGKNGCLPWPRIASDMEFFKEYTQGKKIIMGRKTWESLPGELPNRKHYICTSNTSYMAPKSCEIINDVETYFAKIALEKEEYCFIGGANLLHNVIPHVTKMYLTILENDYDGDVVFPYEQVNKYTWDKKEINKFKFDNHNASSGVIYEYIRR